ncbi:pyridoxal kinase PdxY [Microlunatus flavus]|uniref:pyridoxal kinase n=1 Tax=Microlunatus flavus TaxID=1036181 RepID=A0A1H9FZF4_9ACTN|nr:pyridoxal kinase PdxY [Microlunatus flavus]SEQ43315.1 pyridoxine kinase [Microlunatus flavus]
MKTILSIQSSVAYGHVGNSAATFPLMRMGVEVWPVLTVHFSNNTGYASWRGPVLSADDVRDVVRGIDDLGVLGECDAVLSGYQGAAGTGRAVLDAVALVKQRNPAALYCCDPVLGDVGRGFFVAPGIPELMRDAVVPRAQVVTPNQFELEFLTGRQVRTLAEAVSAAQAARELGPDVVLVTSVDVEDAEPGTLDLLVATGTGTWRVTTPRLDGIFQGAGDLTAAVFLARLLQTDDPADAVAWTASVVFGVLDTTRRSGRRELQLVSAQQELVEPSRRFVATAV